MFSISRNQSITERKATVHDVRIYHNYNTQNLLTAASHLVVAKQRLLLLVNITVNTLLSFLQLLSAVVALW